VLVAVLVKKFGPDSSSIPVPAEKLRFRGYFAHLYLNHFDISFEVKNSLFASVGQLQLGVGVNSGVDAFFH
jgi:hypothetical protein